jgi:hypothetical protein
MCNAGRLFDRMWLILVDVLGGPATAALVRRSIKRAAAHDTGLSELQVEREGFEFVYKVPAGWADGSAQAVTSLRALARELRPLLHELTGSVIVERLHHDPDLSRCRIPFQEVG